MKDSSQVYHVVKQKQPNNRYHSLKKRESLNHQHSQIINTYNITTNEYGFLISKQTKHKKEPDFQKSKPLRAILKGQQKIQKIVGELNERIGSLCQISRCTSGIVRNSQEHSVSIKKYEKDVYYNICQIAEQQQTLESSDSLHQNSSAAKNITKHEYLCDYYNSGFYKKIQKKSSYSRRSKSQELKKRNTSNTSKISLKTKQSVRQARL